MDEFNNIIPEFVTEYSGLLQSMESGLLHLEDGEDGEQAISSILQAIRFIKAGAGFAGLGKIQRLARNMELVLDLCLDGALQPSQPVIDSLLQSLDVLSSLFDRVDEHESIGIADTVQTLEAVIDAQLDSAQKQGLRRVDFKALPPGAGDFDVRAWSLENRLGQGQLYLVQFNPDQIKRDGLTPIQLVHELFSMGEIIDAAIHQPDQDQAEASFHVLFSTALDTGRLLSVLPLGQEGLRELEEDDFRLHASDQAEPEPAPEPEPDEVIQESPLPVARQEASPPAEKKPVESQPAQTRQGGGQLQVQTETSLTIQEGDDQGGEYLTFSLGHENYGVDILSVKEIITVPHLTKLPRAPKHVLGVMNLRGMVVPVMDMRIQMNLPTHAGTEPVVVVLNVGGRCMGAVVDSVSDVVVFQESDIQDPPEFAGAVHREYLRGLCRHDEELIVLLDPDRIISLEAQKSAL